VEQEIQDLHVKNQMMCVGMLFNMSNPKTKLDLLEYASIGGDLGCGGSSSSSSSASIVIVVVDGIGGRHVRARACGGVGMCVRFCVCMRACVSPELY
jgi:hypothetical protein